MIEPQFCIGQRVIVVCPSPEVDCLDEGIITGIACKLPDCLSEEWQYAIQYTKLNSSPWLAQGHIEWVSESDLRHPSTHLPLAPHV
jgi:hypothetical protein